MNQEAQEMLHQMRQFRAVMDGVCTVEIIDGEMVRNDSLPADYTPEVMQLYVDGQLVHESLPQQRQVTYSLLSTAA